VSELANHTLFFLIVTLCVGMVIGATRGTSLNGVLREALRSFVALAGGLILIVVAVHLLLAVVQA
jgi:hypothetical protein